MLFQQGSRNLKIRKSISLILLIVVALVSVSNIFGQEQNEQGTLQGDVPFQKTDEILPPGEMTKQRLPASKSAGGLREYVPRLYPEVFPDDIQDVIVDNNPAIRFDVNRSNRRFEVLLVAYPDSLVLYQLAREEIAEKTTGDDKDVKDDSGTTAEIAGCGGLSSSGNPYPCCSNGGNCTWFAWYRANIVFNAVSSGNGFPASSFGNARNWATAARNAGFPVTSEPGSRTVGVNSTMSAEGHVFFVEYQKWKNQLIASEMQCYTYYGPKWSVQYDRSRANLGYIYPKAKSWRPRVSLVVTPTIWAGTTPVWILFSGYNFTTNSIVDVVTPDGSTVSLSGTQLSNSGSTGLWAQVVFNQRGYWKFKVVGKDGQRSDWVYVLVN